jgi:3-hydroxyisobutyrate dehydrogenase-like beta-hydroxyacid dehydrogenase
MTTSTPTIGFLGLGHMGHGMAASILGKGFPLPTMAHHRREALEDLVAKGATDAESVAALARAAEVILLCLPDAAAVDDILRRAGGIAAHARPGTTVIDCTTSRPEPIQALAADFPALRFLDVPLGRSPKEAWEGRLSVMAGGAAADLARVRPVLEAFADTIQHAGPLGAGHTLKLVNNIVSLGYAAIYSEALALTLRAGLAPTAFDELISSSRMDCAFFQTFMGWVRDGNADSHKFALSLASHAMGDASGLAEDLGLKLGVVSAVASLFAEADSRGFGGANLPELPRAVAEANGLAFPDR